MKANPVVSVMIPCYNHAGFLADCLNSILAQDYEQIELLICDDCSTDDSFAVIQSYESRLRERFSDVSILRNETNCGVTKNVNRMLAQAKGVYLKTIASDDAMAPNAISAMVSYLEEHPQVGVAVANGRKVSEDQHYPFASGGEKIYPLPPDFSERGMFERTARCNQISAPAAMVRRSVYEAYGYYDEQLKVEDYEFWLRILKDGQVRFGFLDQELIFYRINANSMTSMTGNAGLARRRKLIYQSEMDTLKKYKDHLEKSVYSEIVLSRIFSERWLAVAHRLTDWEEELYQQWKAFEGWKDLPFGKRLRFRTLSARQNIKKRLR